MAEDDVDELEAEEEEEDEAEEEDGEEEEEEEDDDDSGDHRKTLLLVASYGVLIYFILTDPSGAAELGRNLGGFVVDQADAILEFIDAALSNPAESSS